MMMGKQQHHDDPYSSSATETITASGSDDACNDGDDEISINSHHEALCEMLGLPSSFTLTIQDDDDDDDDDDRGNDDDETRVVSYKVNNGRRNVGDVEEEEAEEDVAEVTISWIHLPPNASRYFYPISQCTAFCIPQLFTLQECQHWIDLAAGGAQNQTASPSNQQQQQGQHRGFQYITHATHTTPDGSTSFLVALQNPNPHKLSVFHHAPSVELIWNRLKNVLKRCRDGTDGGGGGLLSSSSPIQKLLDREDCGEPVGLNPRLRVLKYDASDQDEFKPHFDATTTTRIGHDQISLLTALIYLKTGGGVDFAGGETLFLNHDLDTNPGSVGGSSTNSKDSPGVVKVTPTTGSVVIFEHDLYHASTPLEWGTKYVLRTDIMFHLEHDPKEKQFQKQQLQKEDSGDTTTCLDDSTCSSSTTPPSATSSGCCCSTMAQLCKKLQVSSKEQEALEELGMLGLSLDAFCSGGPGKFALYQILQSVGISTPTCRALIEGAYAQQKSLLT